MDAKKRNSIIKLVCIYLSLIAVFCVNAVVTLYLLKKTNAEARITTEFIINGVMRISFIYILILAVRFKLKDSALHEGWVKTIVKHRYKLGVVFLCAGLLMGLNGFSLTSWDRFVPTTDSNNIVFGLKRDITSDTWALGIPSIINQVENGSPLKNKDIMTQGADATLMSLPTKDISMVGKPFLWGYLTQNISFGLSWNYLFKLIVLLLSSFEISYFLSKKNEKISLAFAILITFSPAIQWWMGQNMIDIIVLFQACLASWIVFWRREAGTVTRVLAALASISFSSGFITTLYPALQVPLAILLILMMGLVFTNKNQRRSAEKIDGILIALTVAGIVFIALRFLNITQEALTMIANTAYPGKRVNTGGQYGVAYFYHYFVQWVLPLKSSVQINNCEAAAFAPYLPVLFLAFPIYVKFKNNKWYYALFAYLIFLTSWLFVSYPVWFAKASFFAYATESRLALVIGLLSVYLTIVTIAEIKERPQLAKKTGVLIASALAVFVMLALTISGKSIYNGIPLTGVVIWGVSAIIFGLYAYLLFTSEVKKSIYLLFTVTMISGATVNPIAFGESSLRDSDLSMAIQKIEERDQGAYWLIDDQFPYSNYLLAQGVRCFNTLNSYMDGEKWAVVDPSGQYEHFYNRYAHVSAEVVDGSTEIELNAPDAIVVKLDVEKIKKLNIKYILSKRDLSHFGFTKKMDDKLSGFSIYEVTYK